jgi:hypothetical protein
MDIVGQRMTHPASYCSSNGAARLFLCTKSMTCSNHSCVTFLRLSITLLYYLCLMFANLWPWWSMLLFLKDSDPFEKLHLKFIKETLGVNCKALNDALLFGLVCQNVFGTDCWFCKFWSFILCFIFISWCLKPEIYKRNSWGKLQSLKWCLPSRTSSTST